MRRISLSEQVGQLQEMARLLSLVELQRRGNKKPATPDELRRARKRAMKLKTPHQARAAARDAWEMMEKRQIIQVFLDREAELRSPRNPTAKPLFMDKKVVQWGKLSDEERGMAAQWIAATKSEQQIAAVISQLKSDISLNGRAKLNVYIRAAKLSKARHKDWKSKANKQGGMPV